MAKAELARRFRSASPAATSWGPWRTPAPEHASLLTVRLDPGARAGQTRVSTPSRQRAGKAPPPGGPAITGQAGRRDVALSSPGLARTRS